MFVCSFISKARKHVILTLVAFIVFVQNVLYLAGEGIIRKHFGVFGEILRLNHFTKCLPIIFVIIIFALVS